ncbi:hypothetical protein BCR44DRAFT_1432604 [Catenaria anguillulae PL171]|uniref:Uncharacterized protein n=1 Tax=Catenaria anguillulae PL171 TaxID=765915 RepID=A0A1Y2HR21_9FUNG|nr:hypothetical protein BCR44DRAFT_1432604 [Catenaria anguillulae PL171]
MGELSLYAATKRFSEITQDLISTVAESPLSIPLRNVPQAFNKYLLLQLVAEDIRVRLGDVTAGALDIFLQRVATASVTSVVLFSGAVFVLCVGVGTLVGVGLRILQRESRALTTLPYLLPAAALAQAGELSAFVESGGLTLKQAGSQDI